jgi:hypothetical protein
MKTNLMILISFLFMSCGGSQLFVEAGVSNYGIEQASPDMSTLTGDDFIWSEYYQPRFNYKWRTQPFVTIKFRQYLFDGKKYQIKKIIKDGKND